MSLGTKRGSYGWFCVSRDHILEHIVKHWKGLVKQFRRWGMLTSSFCLLHYNARAHTARATQQLLQRLNWKVLDHHAQSQDLPPSNIHLFLHLKKHLASQKFHEVVKNEVTMWLCASGSGVLRHQNIKNLYPSETNTITTVVIMLKNS